MRGRGRSVLSFVFACALVGALAPRPAPTTARTQRSSDFDRGWRFALVNPADITDPTGAYANAADPGYDDSRLARASTSRTTGASSSTPTTEHGTTSGTGFFPGGLGWYRKTFTLPRALGRQADLASSSTASTWTRTSTSTASRSASHPYGYTGFAFDLTDLLHTDGTRRTSSPSRCSNQLPSSRWYSGSGIYRHVHLVVTDPVHVAR